MNLDEQLQYSAEDIGESAPSADISDERQRKPIQVYIENARDDSIGGFTIPLPTTKESLQPWLEAIGTDGFAAADIAIRGVRSSIPGLEEVLRSVDAERVSFDELNYLALKISGLDEYRMDLFIAALEANYHCDSIQDLMNVPENTVRLELEPAFSEEQYGDYLIQMEKDNSVGIFERLEKATDPDDRAFAQYVLRLEAHVDVEAYGRGVADEENGTFTKYGYFVERGDFQETYRGLDDIPMEHRIFSASPPPMITMGVDVPAFLAGLHAAAGDYSRDAEHSLNTLARLRTAEYLLLMDGPGALLTETMHAYRRGTTAFDVWMNATDKPGAQAFSIHLTEVHGEITGHIAQVDITARQLDLLHHSIQYTRVDAVSKSGEEHSYAPREWEAMSAIDRDKIENWTRHFDADDLGSVLAHLDDLRGRAESNCRKVTPSDFLTGVNAAYMAQAQCPQPEMLRVSQTAAKEMLARGDCEVYRLLPEGTEKLSPTDAVKSGLWFSENREFAIRHEVGGGFQKWAERCAADVINRPQERDEQKKGQEPEM